jgi:hypothetical protein
VISECKKSEAHPWVFYTPPVPGSFDREFEAFSRIKAVSDPVIEPSDYKILARAKSLLEDPPGKLAQASHLAFWKDGEKHDGYNQINTAINQVVMAASNRIRMMQTLLRMAQDYLVIICPLIVLDGQIFEYSLAPSGEPNLVDRLQIKYQASTVAPEREVELPDKQKGVFTQFEDYVIDIVTLDRVPQYVDRLEEDMKLISS